MIPLLVLLLIKYAVSSEVFDYNELYGNLGPKVEPQDSEQAVRDLITRLIGDRAKSFNITVAPNTRSNQRDVFRVKKNYDYIAITASSGVAAAWGFHYYLKEFVNCHVSWDGDQINLPDTLPDVDIQVEANDRFRYYQNVCTTSYSFAWWGWKRWEREIDWMALNGFNLVLAFTGQEEIWRRVYLKLGLTEKEINEHFTGPAFLSWNRMGNIRGWGGPLPNSWHNRSVNLQKKILKRMRLFGITPVLPAFAGHVPRAFSRIFPSANLTLLPRWCQFPDQYCCPYMLAPDDPSFNEVGSLFLKEYIQEFGTDHIYNCDPFNEMPPSCEDLDYLRRIGRSIYESINSTDPNGIWMLQGWVFKNDFYFWTKKRAEAFLTSISIGKFLVLDLQAEIGPQYSNLDSFFGQPFIWCMLHNFGGTLGMHGSSEFINNNIFKARQFDNSTLVGVGMTPEGINQNYVIYDLLMDMFWRKNPVNLTEWFSSYARRRYRIENKHAQEAWDLLRQSVYNYSGNESQFGYYTVVQHPKLDIGTDKLWYRESYIYDAWKKLLLASEIPIIEITGTFLVDLVDVTRQAIQLKINNFFKDIHHSYIIGNLTVLQQTTTMFLELLDDLETLLASNSKFLLGNWINSAKRIATTPPEEKIYEVNARNQITLWGPNGEIRDYANKQWSGLIKDYYKPRWQIFLSALNESLTTQTPFFPERVSKKIFSDVEECFCYSNFNYPDTPIGDSIAISRYIRQKYTWDN